MVTGDLVPKKSYLKGLKRFHLSSSVSLKAFSADFNFLGSVFFLVREGWWLSVEAGTVEGEDEFLTVFRPFFKESNL
jgi:hypothetical protein